MFSTEDSPRGLGRTLGKRVGGNPSRVRISYPPPAPSRAYEGPDRTAAGTFVVPPPDRAVGSAADDAARDVHAAGGRRAPRQGDLKIGGAGQHPPPPASFASPVTGPGSEQSGSPFSRRQAPSFRASVRSSAGVPEAGLSGGVEVTGPYTAPAPVGTTTLLPPASPTRAATPPGHFPGAYHPFGSHSSSRSRAPTLTCTFTSHCGCRPGPAGAPKSFFFDLPFTGSGADRRGFTFLLGSVRS